MRSFFINRQYLAAVADRAGHKAFPIDRITAITSKTRAVNDRIPFTVTFHPINNTIKANRVLLSCCFSLPMRSTSFANILR